MIVDSGFALINYHAIEIFELPSASVSKRLPVQTFSYENEFDLHENKLAGEALCHKNGSHEDLFSHWGRENSEMVSFVKKLGKNEQSSQKGLNVFTPPCDYAAVMATLKVLDTIKYQNSAKDEWTAPESFNIIE